MDKQELRKLWDERERLGSLLKSYQMANVAGLTADQKFDLDTERQLVLAQWAKADRAYRDGAEQYAKEQAVTLTPLDMCAIAEMLK